MTATRPVYRLTVYAPASEDPTETTVLTPIAGAAHAEPFVVTTQQGIAGAKPYLGWPSGRQGSIDYTTKRTTTGNLTIPLADFRTVPGGDNAVRWVTAFLGDAFGRTRFKGCKFLLERALDGTAASLVPFAAGRIRNASVTRAQWFEFDVKDFADDLNRPLFKGAPHASITYASLGSLLPNGLVKPYGNCALTPPLGATIGAAFATAPDTVVVNLTSPSDPAAMITQAVLDSNSGTDLRLVELTKVADGTKHYYQWPRGDAALASTNIGGGPTAHFGLTAFPIAMLPEGDARREALPAVGTAVTVSIVRDAPPTEATPLFVNDVSVIQYIADILDGKFSLAPGSTTLRPLAERNTDPGNSWETLLADASFGTMRDVITKLEPKANDYLEKALLQRHNLVLVRDGRGRVDLVDLRRKPTLAGVATLTDADLATDTEPSWDDSRDGAVTGVTVDYYVDQLIPLTDLVASADTFPTLPSSRIRSTKSSILKLNDLSTFKDIGEKIVAIAARGDRISSADANVPHFGRLRVDRLKATLEAAALDFLRPISNGILTAKATYRLGSANAAQIEKGKYFVVQHTKLPDPASNQRGGARLMLCLSCDERDGTLAVQWMDAGTGAVAVAPDITAVASANPYSIDVTVAANGDGDPIEIHVAVTETAVAVRPADTAGEWVFAVQTAAGTVRIANLPSGKRVWVRARSYGTAANMKLPSAWDYAPAPGYLDLAAGDPIDLSQPDPVFTPIATTDEIISPPTASLDLVSEDDAQVELALSGTIGQNGAGPLEYSWRIDTGAWSAWSALHANVTISRAPKRTKVVQLLVRQADGQVSPEALYGVTGAMSAINGGTGQVDPTQPLSGTSHFIPRATDVNGMILDPGSKESQGKELRRLFAKPLFGDPDTLDANIDGLTYGRPLLAGLTSGQIDLAKSGVIGKHLGNIADGGGKRRVNDGATDVNGNVDFGGAAWVNRHAGNLPRSTTDGTAVREVVQQLTNSGHAGDAMQTSGAREIRRLLAKGLPADPDTLDATGLDGLTFKRTTVTQVGYADRAGTGLDVAGYATVGVRGAATVGGRPAATMARSAGAFFVECFDTLPSADTGWSISGALSLLPDSTSRMGRNLLVSSGTGQLTGPRLAFNPRKLYRVRALVRTNAYNGGGAANSLWYLGVLQKDYAGNVTNVNSGAGYVAAAGADPVAEIGMGAEKEYVGWFKGASVPFGTAGLGISTDAANPVALNTGTVTIEPYLLIGYSGAGGSFLIDYFLIDEFDEDGTMRTYSTIEQGGANPLLKSNVKQYDGITSRVIAKGHSTGTARFPGSKILFPENYQNPPLVLLRGGLLSEPRAKWGPLGNGSESGAFNAALPVYEDLVALNLDASGFDLRARLRQKSGSTARSDNFPAGNSLSGLGATTQATLANAPANNDTYTANYTVSGTLTPFPGGSASLDVIVALDTSNDSGGTWQTRATKAYSIRAFGSPRTISWNAETMVAVAQLQAPGARVRLRIDMVDWTDDSGGTMSLAVHGRSGGGDGSGVTYNTSVDNFASKTPDAEDLIAWEAIEVS